MTGIEQLRKLGADAVRGGEVGRAICDIADQIERERECERDTIENLRLELGEARDEAAWVREHGGLEEVRRMFQDADNRRVELCAALGIDLDRGWSDAMAAMRLRLMPEGCEWPRYESEDLVMFGDCVENCNGTCTVNSVRFYSGGGVSVYGEDRYAQFVVVSEPVMRDPIRKARPKVFAADGEPLEVGQTVWDTNGDELVIGAIEDGGHTVACRYVDVGDGIPTHGMWSPSDLTHTKPEPPDSAERIAEDIRRMAEEWCSHPSLREASEKAASSVGEATMGVALSNLSKRCRALAERERGKR